MIHTSPKWLRFKDPEFEAEFQRRYHLRAGKHTQLVLIVGMFVYGLGAIWGNHPWYLTMLAILGPVGGWILCEWKAFHKYAQVFGNVLFGIFFISIDTILATTDSNHQAGHITYLAVINVFVVYTMLRAFLLPSIALSLGISVAHLTVLVIFNAPANVVSLAATGLLLANVIGCIISLQFEKYFRHMFEAKSRFLSEQDIQDRLLDNILPAGIGDKLRNNFEDVIIDCPEVIIITADLANFTAFSSSVSARTLVGLLNKIYSAFDQLADANGLTKIKTMGDAFLLASGIDGKPDAEACVKMAVSMRDTLHRIAASEKVDLDIRIGIAAGPCLAGVVGETRPKFDVWGPAVNAAGELEKSSANGSISIDGRVRAMLPQDFGAGNNLPLVRSA